MVACHTPSQLVIFSDGYNAHEIIFIWHPEMTALEIDSTIKLPEHEITKIETSNCTTAYGTTGRYRKELLAPPMLKVDFVFYRELQAPLAACQWI